MVLKKKNVKKKCKKKKIFFFFTFLNEENQTWYWGKRWLFSIGNGAEMRPLEMGRKSPENLPFSLFPVYFAGNSFQLIPKVVSWVFLLVVHLCPSYLEAHPDPGYTDPHYCSCSPL